MSTDGGVAYDRQQQQGSGNFQPGQERFIGSKCMRQRFPYQQKTKHSNN